MILILRYVIYLKKFILIDKLKIKNIRLIIQEVL